MHQLRRLAAEQLKGLLIAGEQCGQYIQTLFLPQPLHTAVHDGHAGLLFLAAVQLLVAQPEEKFLRVQIHFGGNLAQLKKFLPVLGFQHLDKVLYQAVVHFNAVQKYLKGVFALVGIGLCLRRFFRRLCLCVLGKKFHRTGVHIALKQRFRKLCAVLGGAAAYKFRHAHSAQLLTELLHAFTLVTGGQGDALGRLSLALEHLGHILQIVFK